MATSCFLRKFRTEKEHIGTLVVLAHHGLGDLLMALPLLKHCDSILPPMGKMMVVLKSHLEMEAMQCMRWDSKIEFLIIDAKGVGKILRILQILFKIRSEAPDLLLGVHMEDHILSSLFVQFCKANINVVRKRYFFQPLQKNLISPAGCQQHKSERYLQYGVTANLFEKEKPVVSIPIDDNLRQDARSRLSDWSPDQIWVALAPGSGIVESHKRWPAKHFRKLTKMILDHSIDMRIALIGSKDEQPLLEEVSGGKERTFIFSDLGIRQVIGLIAECKCVVCACSGISHLAAAADVPIVGLYGPTNPGFTGPYTRKLRVIRAGLRCSPCYRYGFIRGCGTPLCMSLIEPKEVFGAVLSCLKGAVYPPIGWYPTTRAKMVIVG